MQSAWRYSLQMGQLLTARGLGTNSSQREQGRLRRLGLMLRLLDVSLGNVQRRLLTERPRATSSSSSPSSPSAPASSSAPAFELLPCRLLFSCRTPRRQTCASLPWCRSCNTLPPRASSSSMTTYISKGTCMLPRKQKLKYVGPKLLLVMALALKHSCLGMNEIM